MIAAGIAVLSVVVLSYSIPVNPCSTFSSRTSDLLAPASPKELYDSAELVVVGKIADSAAKCEGSQVWTHMQIKVEESLKNPQGKTILSAKSYGGTVWNYGVWMEDSPIFKKGDRAFLYLYKDDHADTIYRISPYSGILTFNGSPDETVSGKEILKGFDLQIVKGNTSAIDIARGESTEVILSLESFFGYDHTTNVTISSMTYYNSTTQETFYTPDVPALTEYGISMAPAHALVTPHVNGTAMTAFRISASTTATLGMYDISITGTETEKSSRLNLGTPYTFVRINVTEADPIQQPTIEPPGVSLVIEEYGEREFYQDRNVFLPTMLEVTKSESLNWQKLSWPSIGPNYVITEIEPANNNSEVVVFDYYESLGINGNLTGIVYDEFMLNTDLSPPPATSGRYFGFEWNQTSLDGTKASAGRYEVVLVMPVLIGEMTSGEVNRTIVMLRSEPEYFWILLGSPRYLEHDLSLSLIASKTALETREPFSHSLFLINNGDSTQYFSTDAVGTGFFTEEKLVLANNAEQSPCYFPSANGIKREDWGHMSMFANYFFGAKSLEPEGLLALANETLISAPSHPGIYYLAGKITLTIADEDLEGKAEFDSVKVSCLDVVIENPIMLNVTAPVQDGVSLVLKTDKDIYKQNETVAISLYIENKSDKPFKLEDASPSIGIKDAFTGREIYRITWVADYSEYPTVQPHSTFSLEIGTQFGWDQTVYSEDGKTESAKAGRYLIEAIFTHPYLQSETHTITIE